MDDMKIILYFWKNQRSKGHAHARLEANQIQTAVVAAKSDFHNHNVLKHDPKLEEINNSLSANMTPTTTSFPKMVQKNIEFSKIQFPKECVCSLGLVNGVLKCVEETLED